MKEINKDKSQHLRQDDPFAEVPVIFAYTRAQAIEDGVLIDLTEWARETSFKVPVACTSEVWHRYITPPAGTREFGQSERGRAHDTLWMLFVAIKRRSSDNQLNSRTDGGKGEARRGNDQLLYEVIFLQAPQHHETIQLKSICGPGDNGEPVITIMLPNED